jgi:signal transduction histidine kinase
VTLAGGIAHDLNNMLVATLGALNLMERKFKRGDADVQKRIDAALDATRCARQLCSRLLAFSRQQPLDSRPLDAN